MNRRILSIVTLDMAAIKRRLSVLWRRIEMMRQGGKMNKEKPSRTAEQVAISRYIESTKPADERLCYDPYANEFITTKLYSLLPRSRMLRTFAVGVMAFLVRGHHYYVVMRTRYIDDYLNKCIEDGIQQIVIMGAGYDTRAYRFKKIEKIKIFEIDYPTTQEAKKTIIKKIFKVLPENVIYISIDFTKEKLADVLFRNKYNKKLKTLFIWEGTTPYITADSVDETLSFIRSSSGKGSSIIYDYILKSVIDGTCRFKGAQWEFDYLRRKGEPYTFGIEEDKIIQFMEERNFKNVVSIGSDELKKIYSLNNRKTAIKEWWRIVHAATGAD